MRFVHGVHARVFVTPEDDESAILGGLHWLIPFEWDKEKILLKRECVEGVEGNPIVILSAFVLKEALTNDFLELLVQRLGTEQCALLVSQKESRLDEALHFFIRLDTKAVLTQKTVITDSGKCFHLMLTVAAFPAKRASALAVVEKIFKQGVLCAHDEKK